MNTPLNVVAYNATQKPGVVLQADNCIRISASGKRASIQVRAESTVLRDGQFWTSARNAHISMPVEMAQKLAPVAGEDLNAKLGAVHCIIMVEQTTPFYEGQEPKKRGADGDIITDDAGNAIYQDYRVAPAGTADVLVARTLTSTAISAPVAEAADAGDLAGS